MHQKFREGRVFPKAPASFFLEGSDYSCPSKVEKQMFLNIST